MFPVSYPACIDDVGLIGDEGAVVGGEKQEEACDFFWRYVLLQGLSAHDFRFVLGRPPQLTLAFG